MCIPALVGLFSYGYAFYYIIGGKTAAITGGIVSAIVLLIIDRGIMAYGRPGVVSIGMLGRMLFAFTIGLLLAEPMILKVFEDSITEQQHTELFAEQEQTTTVFDSKIDSLQLSLRTDEARLRELQQDYTAEMDGTGGSGVPNKGPIYEQKYRDYLDFKAIYDSKKASIDRQIATVELKKEQELSMVVQTNANGLIGRMRALDALGQKEPIVTWATWLLRLFFMLIELIPLLLKISPTGDRGLYYKLVDTFDEERENVVKANSEERKQIIVKEEQVRYAMQYSELCQKEIQVIAESKGKDTMYMMEKMASMAEKKLEFKLKAAKKIPDEGLSQRVYEQIDTIFDGFVETLTTLNSRSNDNYTSDLI